MDDNNRQSDIDEEPHGLSRTEIYYKFVSEERPSIEAPQKFFEFPDDANDGKTYGIDVSHHKGTINWKKVTLAGTQFSYAKATEGRTYQDNRFEENHKGARAEDLPVGAYHFLSHGTLPKDQANNFINTYKPFYKTNDLPPVLDLEWDYKPGTNHDRWEGQSGELIVNKCLEWLAIIEEEFSKSPLIYTNKNWWETRLGNEGTRLSNYKIWMSRYGKFNQPSPPMPSGLKWAIWQFTEHGKIPGVTGHVDVNFTAPDFDIQELIS